MRKKFSTFFEFVSHSRSRNDLGVITMPVDLSLQSRDLSVRIVHAGGREELYQHAVPVSQLMEKYPGMCIARPEVFKKPHDSLLWYEDRLLPGHKYYIIPATTVEKLKHRHQEKFKAKEAAKCIEDMSDARITWDLSGENLDESVYSAKEFYVAKPPKVSKVPNESLPKYSRQKGGRVKKPFVPPLPRVRSLQDSGW